ncbi:hypothetical protein [Catenulispora pinisilvae]|uniref:hypothetical protein n=1 Tax=Catenulispora pinisilvae TaxID=2705253 RepID=UPI001892644B|nr:hypothetical protein [Catenulispora pinisilvae]
MPTVAQILNERRDLSGGARYTLATVTAASAGVAELVGRPGSAKLRARIPADLAPAPGDLVLVLVAPAVTCILVRLEKAT